MSSSFIYQGIDSELDPAKFCFYCGNCDDAWLYQHNICGCTGHLSCLQRQTKERIVFVSSKEVLTRCPNCRFKNIPDYEPPESLADIERDLNSPEALLVVISRHGSDYSQSTQASSNRQRIHRRLDFS